MQGGRDTGTSFEAIDSKLPEPYASRNEAYLADCWMEPRKLLRDVELSIKIGA